MSTDTPGQPPSGSSRAVGSSSTRKSSPPAIHSAAVQTGYRATNASSTSPTLHIPPLLSPASAACKNGARQRDEERRRGRPAARARSPSCSRTAKRRRSAPRARPSARRRTPRSHGRATPGAAARIAPAGDQARCSRPSDGACDSHQRVDWSERGERGRTFRGPMRVSPAVLAVLIWPLPRDGSLRGPGRHALRRTERTPTPRPGGRAHRRGEAGLGEAPARPLRDPGAPLPRDRPGERLLERCGRRIRRRHRGLRQADDR